MSEPRVMVARQMSIHDYLDGCKADLIDWWGLWRDAQIDADIDKALVDEVFGEYMRTLDKLRETLIPF